MILDFFLDKLAEEKYPIIQEKRCLYNKIQCSICMDICPEEAISIKSKIVIDENLCGKCGICKSTCPTQAISMKGLGEENILRTINDKRNPIFTCSKTSSIGNLRLNCLSGMHPELLAALFLLYGEKTFYFNMIGCEKCHLGDKISIFEASLDKAVNFAKLFGIDPGYVICFDEKELQVLSEETISRRDLFLLLKKGTTNLATHAVDTVLNENNQLSIRKVLLKAIERKEFEVQPHNVPFFDSFKVSNDCNGCEECKSICPGEAWKVENGEKIKVLHNAGKCYKCGQCKSSCPQKAIEVDYINMDDLIMYNLKKEITLNKCHLCDKKFFSKDKDIDKCPICEKKEALRKRLATN